MIEILSYIIAALTVAYIVTPLLNKSSSQSLAVRQQSNKLNDLVNQRTTVRETKNDLEFDFQTGKLDKEDFEELSKEQDVILSDIENQVKQFTGLSTENIDKKLDEEILLERTKLEPDLQTTCNKCGQSFKPGDQFCSNCGTKI